MTRDVLALRWANIKRYGEKLEAKYDDFREWITERLKDAHRDNPKGAERPFSLLLTPRARWEMPVRKELDQWDFVASRSHLRGNPSLGSYRGQINSFNLIAGRYRILRQKREYVAYGSSRRPPEDYTPSPKAREILATVARLDEERTGLAEAESKAAIWRLVYREIEGGELQNRAAEKIGQTLRADMSRKAFGNQFPTTPKELVELARELSQRWDNVGPSFEPPN